MRLIVLSVALAFCLEAQQTGDVRAFGAAGDGVHDDTAAIAAALTAAAAQGGSLYFGRGTYSFASPLVIGRSGIHLVCESGGVLKFTGAGAAVSFASVAPAETTDVGIENCTIEGNPAATDGILLERAHHVSLRHVRVRNLSQARLRTASPSSATTRISAAPPTSRRSGRRPRTASSSSPRRTSSSAPGRRRTTTAAGE